MLRPLGGGLNRWISSSSDSSENGFTEDSSSSIGSKAAEFGLLAPERLQHCSRLDGCDSIRKLSLEGCACCVFVETAGKCLSACLLGSALGLHA